MISYSRRSFLSGAGLTVAVAGGSLGWVNAALAADGPAATIQTFYVTVLDVMKSAKQLGFDGRYARLQPAIARAFDLGLMARIAIGPTWAGLPAAQQQQLAASFARYMVSTYANQFDGYAGERFDVDPNPVANPNGTIVQTKLVRQAEEPIALNYLMRQNSAGAWQVIDIFLSGTVSELATRRSEFVAVLQRDGAAGLVRLLDRRAEALRTG